MRIIAGRNRGRNLLAPEGDATRPITDRVKQSLFDILAPKIPGARVYDCFAGTGSMGLECLSRSAARVTFFEADRSALGRLKRNVEAIDDAHRCQIIPGNLFQWFAHAQPPEQERADLVFLDPPYRFLNDRPADLQALARAIAERHLAVDGIVIFRHDSRDALSLTPLQVSDERAYGGMIIEFLRLPAASQKDDRHSAS